jgi:hypothetical protein
MRHRSISLAFAAVVAVWAVGFGTSAAATSFEIQAGTLQELLHGGAAEQLDLTASSLSFSGSSLELDLVGLVTGTRIQTVSPLVTSSSSPFTIAGGQQVDVGNITGSCLQASDGSLSCNFSVRGTGAQAGSLWRVNNLVATPESVAAMPEPGAPLLFALGCLVAGAKVRRKA